ncbi:hypothetical protein HPB51_010846 [Rhipicephalus microplus]|uniref:Uncharacterized protein n=1 Tax=Rhipicephalus microplus TaxID=6941 RepID=A0A9J6DM82_RHIMP|nr:hypothetical protein HPB51_010846 [Rhipicephalus microplus]
MKQGISLGGDGQAVSGGHLLSQVSSIELVSRLARHSPSSKQRGRCVSPCRRVNHFSTHYELTRKDLLAKHMQRYQRKRGKSQQPPVMLPSTYVLPRDYSMFVDEYKRVGGLWIVKPCGKGKY